MTSALVPIPRSVRSIPSQTRLADGVVVEAPDELREVASWLRRTIERPTGWRVDLLPVDDDSDSDELPAGSIRLLVGTDPLMPPGPESYVLEAADDRVTVRGATEAGVFYGLQTLRQLLPDDFWRSAPVEGRPRPPVVLEGVEVIDGPGFEWRGIHLDVARHFLPKAFVLRLVELAAAHKLNVLHLHLTDDQGWRVPIEKYPRLVEVGAWRRESPLGHASDGLWDGRPHGGFYSKDDLREIVAYATEHHMTVLPEIDMPGHMVAAIAAYPELGNSTEQREVMTSWGISEHVLNLEESTIAFCTDVLAEVLEIFPSRYVHVGGDECPTSEWESSTTAKSIMQREGYTSARQLQGWFTDRIGAWLSEQGRVLVGWDEILEGGAPAGAVVMSWRDESGGIDAASAGHDVVMAPQQWCYFDWSYARNRYEPRGIRPALSVEKVYSFSPVPAALVASGRRRHVLGAQCQLWTEYVATPNRAEYQYFPRVSAFSEVVWSPWDAPRSYPEFELRLSSHVRRLDAMGVNYRPLSGPTPGQMRAWKPPV